MARVSGVKLDMGRLTSLRKSIDKRTDSALDALAVAVQAEAQGNIVRQDIIDTGALLNDVSVSSPSRGVRRVGTGREYGVFHEFGTRRHKARPWLRPALDAAEPLARDLFGKVVKP